MDYYYLEGRVRCLSAQRDELLEACKEWMKYDSEHFKNTPCPDPILRENYRLRAVKLTKEAIAKATAQV